MEVGEVEEGAREEDQPTIGQYTKMGHDVENGKPGA